MSEPRRLTDDEFVTVLRNHISTAEGMDSDELASNREKALDYYYARKRGDEDPGRSQVISTDVADMIEAVIAQIMPAFQIDNFIEFEAEGEDDEEQAQNESDAVNYMIMQRNNGFTLFQESIRDALLLRNGIIEVGVETTVRVERDEFTDISADDYIAVTTSPPDDGVEIEILNESVDDDGRYDVTIERTITTDRLIVESVDPTMFLWDKNHDSIYLQDIGFCAARHLNTANSSSHQSAYAALSTTALPRHYPPTTLRPAQSGRMPTAV